MTANSAMSAMPYYTTMPNLSMPAMGGLGMAQPQLGISYMPSQPSLMMGGVPTMSALPSMSLPSGMTMSPPSMTMSMPSMTSMALAGVGQSQVSGYTGLLPNGGRNCITPESEGSRASSSPPSVNGGFSADLPPPEKNEEYLKELQEEKESLESSSIETLSKTHTLKLLEQEMGRITAGGSRLWSKDQIKYVDVYRERPIRLTVRALVPVREHPKFNFVGKLLGPKGNSMKRLQEETMTKMAVLGKGSMRDKQKEEDLRLSNYPKYQHLHEDLHVEITAFAPPAEAHARIAFALTEVRKYLIPDSNDDIRHEQMREMELLTVNGGNLADSSLLKTVSPMSMTSSPVPGLGQQQVLTLPLGATQLTSVGGSLQPPSYLPSSLPLSSPTITGLPTKYREDGTPNVENQTPLLGQNTTVQKIRSGEGEVRNCLKVLNSGDRGKNRQLATPYSRIP